MKKIFITSVAVLSMALTSCNGYLDINEDPNSPAAGNVTTDMLMPAIEMNIAASYGDYLRIVGGYYSQHYAQDFGTENYVDYSQFIMSATRCDGMYVQLNQRALSNLATVLEKSEAQEDWGTYLAATTLRAFTYQALVDCFGEVPYSDAMKGNATPKYDEGKDIYEGLIAELENAKSKASAGDMVCTNFLYSNQSAAKWLEFANALELRLLMRMANVADVTAQVDALIAEGNFPTEDVAYTDCWSSGSGSESPFYSEEFSTTFGSTQVNVIANLALIGSLQQDSYTDPRLAAFFETNSNGKYVGGVSGTNHSTIESSYASLSAWCRPVASYDMPVYYITVSEIEFFLAEHYARKGDNAQAEAHYNAAVEASFATAGVDGAADNLALYPYTPANWKKCIGEAKWVALSGVNNFEAYCELRRLDYPAFGSKSGSDFLNLVDGSYTPDGYEPFTLYTPLQVYNLVGANKMIERFPYAASSSSTNKANTPEFKGYTTPVFWGE